jgi:hypothetical protein
VGCAQRLAAIAVEFSHWSKCSFEDLPAPCAAHSGYRQGPSLLGLQDAEDWWRWA